MQIWLQSLIAVLKLFPLPLAAVLVFQSLFFLIAVKKKNNGLADVGWGIGFIIISAIALVYHLLFLETYEQTRPDPVFILIIAMVCTWGIRLSIYLYIRNWSKPEDWRYAKWREEWGDSFYLRSFLQVFVLQGFFMIIIGSPILLASLFSAGDLLYRPSYSIVSYTLIVVGTILWLIGFFFQAVGDYQLFVFKKAPSNKGKVMRYGVWQYTRHPNYFGEASMWWGIFLLSCVSADTPIAVVLRMIGPATITFMLLRVSGVTMLEGKYKGNKEYEDYQRNTSSFLPMPIKKGASL